MSAVVADYTDGSFTFRSIDLACGDFDLRGLPELAYILLRKPGEGSAYVAYGRGRFTSSERSVSIEMVPSSFGEHPQHYTPIIRDGVFDVLIKTLDRDGPDSSTVLRNAYFRTSPAKGTSSIEPFREPDTITLTREAFTNALREAAAKGMDNTSGPSCRYAASCRQVTDEILEAIEAGRFVPDDYVGYVEEERRSAS